MTLSSQRAKHLGIASLALCLFFFVATIILGRWSGFAAVGGLSFMFLSSALIWFVLAVQFHQRHLAEQEKLDLGQLASENQTETIFTEQHGRPELLAVAQGRLKTLEKWFVPILGGVIAVYQFVFGLYLLYLLKAATGPGPETKQPLLCGALLVVAAFVGFLMSRYATGMSTEAKLKELRAGGSSLLGASILAFVMAACLALAQFKFPVPVKVMAYVIGAVLVILGVETAANGILDIYRPRIKDQYQRASFDSRLLGVMNEPGEILHTLAGAIDYQFGFKVSQTWFYQLLSEAIVPLVLLAAVVLHLLSCLVVVNPNEQAIVERFGNPTNKAGEVRLLEPGLSLKWPWPIDIARRFGTEEVREIYVGYQPKIDPETGLPEPEEQLLWGKKHYENEEPLLVASPQTGESAGAVPVSLVNANIPVHYRIDNFYDYLYNHEQPDKLLRAICYRELARFAASSTVEVDSPEQLENSIFGAGRQHAQDVLTARIQAGAKVRGLGIEILFVGLQGIHPPVDVAPEYEKVIGAVQQKQAAILNAHTYKNVLLSRLAGSVGAASSLYDLALKYDQVDSESAQAKTITDELDRGFTDASGEIFATLRAAQAYRYERASLAEASGKRFADQLKAYRAAPNIYKRQLRLDAFRDTLEGTRKYVVVADANDVQIYELNLKEKLTPSLYDLPGLEDSK